MFIFSVNKTYHNIFFPTDRSFNLYFLLPKILQWFIVSTYPDQNLEGVDSIIYSPLNVIHQIVSGASDHHRRDGTILSLCLKIKTKQHVQPKTHMEQTSGLKWRLTKLEQRVIYHVWRPPPECPPPLSGTRCHSDPSLPELEPSKKAENHHHTWYACPFYYGSNTWSEPNMMPLTILGSATAPTVLHNLLRSHLELSLRGKKEGFRAGKL